MNLLQAFAGLASLVAPTAGMVNTAKDQHHMNRDFIGEAIWIFGLDGVSIFNPDGSENLKTIDPKDICHEVVGYRGNPEARLLCSFYDVVSDGKKYVWAAVTRGIPKIDILDIDTGDIVGSFSTCMNPTQLEYHPLREEIWVRCTELHPNATTPSYMDVFSTASPSVSIDTEIFFSSNYRSPGSPASKGYIVVDNSLGDVGYITDRDQPYIFKIDLSTKKIIDKFDLPLAYGGIDAVYSRMNKHIFVRADVCCTCGFEGADNPDCGRYSPDLVNVTTGNQAGQTNVPGVCFYRCHGFGADTIGVYEFDTTTETIVGSHLMKEGFTGDPYPSPDGKFIVMIGRNGGTTVRVLKTGLTSAKSTIFSDLVLDFNSTGNEDDSIFSDLAFVERNGKNMIIFVAGPENRAAIVDVDDIANPTYVNLANGESTARYQKMREVEWAVGTDYVWVSGDGAKQVYIIDVMKKALVRTIDGVSTRKMISVVNFAKMNAAKMQQDMVDAAIAASYAQMKVPEEDTIAADAATEGSKKEGTTNSIESEAAPQTKVVDDNDVDPVGIIGLALGVCALIVGTMNVYVMSSMKNQISSNKDDLVSLGSKDIA